MPQQEHDSTIPRELRLTAVGRIVAGIVHDANNALAVAVWNLERASRSLPANGKEAESANTAIASTMKAAALLQRVLEYAGHASYDPSLVNLDEMLSRLFVEAAATVEGDINVDCQIGGGVGPVMLDETLLELGLLDLVAALSRHMAKDGSIILKAANLSGQEGPPPEAAGANILLSMVCTGLELEHLPPLQSTVLQHFARLAGGGLTLMTGPGDRCEIRLYLPRAVASSADGDVFV